MLRRTCYTLWLCLILLHTWTLEDIYIFTTLRTFTLQFTPYIYIYHIHITTRTFALQLGYLLFCKTAVAVPCCSELHRKWALDYRLGERARDFHDFGISYQHATRVYPPSPYSVDHGARKPEGPISPFVASKAALGRGTSKGMSPQSKREIVSTAVFLEVLRTNRLSYLPLISPLSGHRVGST